MSDPRRLLKVKASLPQGFWSPEIVLERYGVRKYVDDPSPAYEGSVHV